MKTSSRTFSVRTEFEPIEPRLMFSSVAVIDAALGDFDVLRSSIRPDSEVVLFNRETDSFRDVINNILAQADPGEDIESISIFSHGRDGAFQLGSDWIDADALSASPDAWATLGDRLSDEAIISLFSCETARSDRGRAFVDDFATLTGADVYASDDLTGLGGDLVLEVASSGSDTPWSNLTASPVDLSLLSSWEETLAGDISGTVYEDVDGDGDIADDGVGVSGVTVEVFLDDGDGTINAGDVSQGTTTTAGDGTYSFAGLADGTYWVVVNSKEVAPSAGFNALFDQGDVWAEQTYGSVGAVSFDGSYSYLGGAGALYGGMQLERSDDATALTSAEHVTRATVAGGNVTGVDSGFSFQVVTRTGDSDDDLAADRTMQGGLRQFILNSNAIVGTQTSQFAMSTADSNYNSSGTANEWTFQPNGVELPGISDAVVLDGTTQSSYVDAPVIEIDGSLAGANEDGLNVHDTAGGTVIRGLAINMFEDDGISLDAQTTIEACYIGIDITGTVAERNAGQGIYVGNDADGSIIGGTTSAQRNVISGNLQEGIYLDAAFNITIQGNYIGLDAAGMNEIANSRDGIAIVNSSDTILIGGDVAGAGNVITGNDYYGIEAESVTNLTISGNLIGTDAAGTSTFQNYYGILLESNASNVLIGGTTAAERNVVSGSEYDGIRSEGASNVTIYGNYVGLDITGTNSLGNGDEGIEIRDNSSNVTIGGSGAGMANVIGGNNGDGIKLDSTTNAVIEGNLIGLDATGTLDRSNGNEGIEIGTGADGVQILGNTVGRSGGYGMYVESANAIITGNQIGTDLAGTTSFDNWSGALYLKNTATGATIGGTLASQRNIISGSTGNGITVDGTSNVTIQGNYIGLDANGDVAMGNGGYGISLINAADLITIGGSAAGAGNVISGNSDDGVYVTASTNVTVQGNIIGLDANGTAALANTGDGIDIGGTSDTITIGGTLAGERNIISGNDESGIEAGDVTNLIIRGNYIGTDINAAGAFGNGSDGVSILSGANGAIIGGTVAGAGNTIANSGAAGVSVDTSTGVQILGNNIYSNTGLGIDLNGDGVTPNDDGDGDAGSNNYQNFPVLENVLTNEADTLWLYGSLNSSAGVTYRIEFFSNTAPDSSGYGEGETYLNHIEVTTDGNGDASFETTLAIALAEGMYITATATNLTTLETGEFSLASLAAVPTISLEAGSAVTHTISKSATRVSASGDVTTNADYWNGGTLVLNLTGAVQAYDSLTIRNGVAGITLSGTDVQYNSVTIGTTSATEITGNDTMTITFNTAADQVAVDAILRALYFEVLDDSSTQTAQRFVNFNVTNALSYSATDQVTVNLKIVVVPAPKEPVDDEEDTTPVTVPSEPVIQEPEETTPIEPSESEIDVEDETVNFDDDSNVVTPGMPSESQSNSDTQDSSEENEEQNEDSQTQKDDDNPQENEQDEHDRDDSKESRKDQQDASDEQNPEPATIETVGQNSSGDGQAGGPVSIIDRPGSLNVYRNKPVAQSASLETFSEEIQKSMEEETVESRREVQTVTLVAGTTTMLLSTGYLVWFIQAGLLKSALLTSLPLWRWVDPLPILAGNKPHERAARIKRKRKDKKLDRIEGMFETEDN